MVSLSAGVLTKNTRFEAADDVLGQLEQQEQPDAAGNERLIKALEKSLGMHQKTTLKLKRKKS